MGSLGRRSAGAPQPDILWISLETPDVLGGGGQRRQFHHVRVLHNSGLRVEVAALAGPQSAARVSQLVPIHRFVQKTRRLRPSRAPSLDEVLTTVRPRRAIIAHVETAAAVAPALTRAGVPFLVDFHNVMSRWHDTRGEDEQAMLWAARERAALEAAASATVCSEEEEAALRALGTVTPLEVAPHGVDPAEWPDDAARGPRQPALALIGSWSHRPNAEAAEWLVSEVWPLVRLDVPESRLLLFGPGEPPRSAHAAGVEAHGRVDDLAMALGRVRIATVPIRTGIGARVKFIESLASGATVVSTAVGREGFAADGAFVCAEEPRAFAGACVALLRDEAAADALGRRGRELALSRYRWETVSVPLLEFAHG